MPLALAVVAFALALAQSPGKSTSDTKIDLHVDPLHFLGQVASVWSPTASLGHVQGGQYSGYLWPMGPFFALGHLLGLSGALTERLWLGGLLALAALGAVRLLDRLTGGGAQPAARLLAGALYMLNPYVVVFASRTTVFLLAYAALPWLLLVVHHGLREPRRWWWPAAFALLVTSTAGGVNATVTAMILIGPVLLVLHEAAVGAVTPRAAAQFGWRTVAATSASSIWWVVPLLVQSRYGLNFLRFTEHVGAIWATTSLTESLRLMGYWPSYLGVGYTTALTPYYGDAPTLLFTPTVIAATLLIPALALGAYAWTRRWRYGPFLLACALITLLVMTVGWPAGTPSRRGADFVVGHVNAIQFLRTTYKAAPLLALATALLGAAGLAAAWERIGGTLAKSALAAALAALVVFAALPIFQGRALELTWTRIPSAWQSAAHDLDTQLPRNARALVLPGQAFAFYTWGGTVDPILPSLTRRPVAIRNVPPYDDLHAVDFLWTVDDRVQQQRLVSGELPPLLDLMSARSVITATDDDTARSGATAPATAARELAGQPGFAHPTRSYGPVRAFPAEPGSADAGSRLPEVRRYDIPARGLLRVEPAARPTIVDGSAAGIADAAALGELPAHQAILYAGDLSTASLREQASAGAGVIISDSNRRQVYVASRTRQNVGWVLPATEAPATQAATLDPFPRAGAEAQTVATFEGARYVTAPYNPDIAEFPEHAPIAAFDGNPATAWLADPTLDQSQRWVEIALARARPVPSVDVLPDGSNPLIAVTQVTVNGEPFAVHPGWNRLHVALSRPTAIRVAITQTRSLEPNNGSVGGIAEVRIPGVRIREALRPPVLAEQALRGANLSHTSLTYLFERTTADQPLQRGAPPRGVILHGDRLQQEAALVSEAQDAETGIRRSIDPPAARRFTLSGLATATPAAPDSALDALAGTGTGGARLDSSARLQGRPGYRASFAFDGRSASAWAAPFGPGHPAWIAWHTRRPELLRSLRLTRSGLPVRFPTVVALSADGAVLPTLRVAPDGAVVLPRPMRGSDFRLTVDQASGSDRGAVAIAEITGAALPRVREPSPTAPVRGRCGDLDASVAGRTVPLRVSGSVVTLNSGQPLRLIGCGGPAAAPATRFDVTIPGATLRPLLVSLHSPAPSPLAHAAVLGTGAVTNPGTEGRDGDTGARVTVRGPSWLVFGQSYDRGWTATCDGRLLGTPHVVDGFANGWPLDRGCRSLSVTFAPQSYVTAGLIAGAIACLVLLLIVLLRRPGPGREDAQAAFTVRTDTPALVHRWDRAPALAAGAAAVAAFGFGFGLRAGAVIGPAYALILWRGITTRRLSVAAFGLLLAVVALYLLFPGPRDGGYDNSYATRHLAAHWVAVAAFALLALVLVRDISRAMRREGRGRAASPGADASPPTRP